MLLCPVWVEQEGWSLEDGELPPHECRQTRESKGYCCMSVNVLRQVLEGSTQVGVVGGYSTAVGRTQQRRAPSRPSGPSILYQLPLPPTHTLALGAAVKNGQESEWSRANLYHLLHHLSIPPPHSAVRRPCLRSIIKSLNTHMNKKAMLSEQLDFLS